MAEIRKFGDGSFLEYGRGAFDDWCVYLTRPGKKKYAPTDIQYFEFFQLLARRYKKENVYSDFIDIYNMVSNNIEGVVFDKIDEFSHKYKELELEYQINMTVIYMGMVAEQNKKYTKLGKRVKRLGFYQTVILDYRPSEAAYFSKGRKWFEIDEICQTYGF